MFYLWEEWRPIRMRITIQNVFQCKEMSWCSWSTNQSHSCLRSPFLALASKEDVTQFSHVLFPPLHFGNTWSTVSCEGGSISPVYIHWNKSLRNTPLLLKRGILGRFRMYLFNLITAGYLPFKKGSSSHVDMTSTLLLKISFTIRLSGRNAIGW